MNTLLLFAALLVGLASSCRDILIHHCFRYTPSDSCHFRHLKYNCEKTCGYCGLKPGCVDNISYCAKLAAEPGNLCETNDYVRRVCKKTCICNRVTSKPTIPPTYAPSGSCGRPQVAHSRVVGGKTAVAHSWPWQIGLHRSGRFICGGSIINSQWIVTAAHCVARQLNGNYMVRLGDHDRRVGEGEQSIKVSKIIVHKGYGRMNNDIALLQLSKPAIFGKNVQPVCLPQPGDAPAVGTKCYITGWGKMKHPGRSVPVLQQLALTIQSKAACAKKNKYVPITDQMLCAANTDVSQNQSGCHGDSGGPFVCQNDNGSWTLHGAVSWGSPRCNAREAYSVFARIAEFRTWIEQNIQ